MVYSTSTEMSSAIQLITIKEDGAVEGVGGKGERNGWKGLEKQKMAEDRNKIRRKI